MADSSLPRITVSDPEGHNYTKLLPPPPPQKQLNPNNSPPPATTNDKTEKKPSVHVVAADSDSQNHTSDTLKIHDWPTGPRKLKERNTLSLLMSIGDIILALSPILFIVLGAVAWTLHHRPVGTSRLETVTEQATQLGPTVFPILFAAVAGRTLKMVARFQAERGAKLGTLELLVASQSVWGAFESQLLMRRLTVVGAHIFVLWALSPLGGQASLRPLGQTGRPVYGTRNLTYLDTGPLTNYVSALNSDDAGYVSQVGNALYASSLLQSNQSLVEPRDSYGNVRVPRLDKLNGTADGQGWVFVEDVTSPVQYASLVGVPVTANLPDGAANYSIEASYLSLACNPGRNISFELSKWENELGLVWKDRTTSKVNPLVNSEKSIWTSFFLDTYLKLNDDARLEDEDGLAFNASWTSDPIWNATRSILWGSLIPWMGLMVTNCSVTYVHVEAFVNCSSPSTCAVTRVRPSQQDDRPIEVTPFDTDTLADNFFDQFPYATGQSTMSGSSTPTEIFMSTLSSPFTEAAQTAAEEDYVNLLALSTADFSARLSLIMNTYWQISIGAVTYDSGLPAGTAVASSNRSFNEGAKIALKNSFIALSGEAQVTTTRQIWVCDFLWLTLLFVSTVVLLLLGAVGIILKLRTKAPDMLGFVSSLTYDNPYVPLETGSTIEGMERTRRLRDLKVRIGDVRGKDTVGHVAFTVAEPHVMELSRDKHYV